MSPPKNDSALADAIARLSKSMVAQFQELRSSQECLSSKLESTISEHQSAVKDLQFKFSCLDNLSLSTPNLSSLPPLLLTPLTPSFSNLQEPSPTFQIKTPKIHLSHFDGSNPHAWLFQAEQYFSFYNIPHTQRLSIATFYMSGRALSWFQWMHQNQQLQDWESFTRALELRFGPSTFINPQAALFKLKQTSSVTSYQINFENLSNREPNLSEDHLLNYFISGLQSDIQRELIVLKPHSFTQALALAKLIESKFQDSRNPSFRSIQPPPQNPLTKPKPIPSTIPIKWLTPTEMQAGRVKGLCFNCDEQYQPRHKCRTAPFLLLQADEDSQGKFMAVEAIDSPPPLSSLPLPPPP